MKAKRLLMCVGASLIFVMSIISNSIAGVYAQNSNGPGNGFRISPVRYELVLSKGSSETVKLTVENPTNSPINANVLINDFEASNDESGKPNIMIDPNSSVVSNSFKTIASTPTNIDIPANKKVELPVTIKINSNSSAGGYYGAVRVVPSNTDGKNVSLAASVGTIFLITVPGKLTEQLQLVQFTATKNGSNGRFFLNSGDMSIVTRLKNTGNIHVKPFGKIQVADRSGKVVQEIEFNNIDPKANILPNSTRKFEDKLKDQKWIGKYTVTANLGYGTSGSLITAKTYFWIIPTWFVIAISILLIAVVVGAFLIYRRYKIRPVHNKRARR